MLLVDNDIQKILNGSNKKNGETYIENGEQECITNIGYDLRAEHFYFNEHEYSECELQPGESAFVAAQERVCFDDKTVGKIVLKNSRIRMGLTMDAPLYQPGHKATILFRLTNLSSNNIKLLSGEKYTTLLFDRLPNAPSKPYNGTFQDEISFRNLGNYYAKYIKQIEKLNGKIQTLKTLEKSIYTNVLTILSIFVAIFTVINSNITFMQNTTSILQFIALNTALLGAISFLIVLIANVLERKGKKSLWTIPLACLVVAIITYRLD